MQAPADPVPSADRGAQPIAAGTLAWLLRRAPIIAALIGLALSGIGFWLARANEIQQIRSILELRAEWRSVDLRNKLEEFNDALSAVGIFIGNATDFDQTQFSRAARRAYDENHGAMRTIIWAPRIKHGQLAEFLKAAHDSGQRDYRLLDLTPGGRLVPAAERAEYFPDLYRELFEGQLNVAGITFDSDPQRRAAMVRARDEGRMVRTEPIGLATTGEPAYLIFRPVYRGGVKPATLEQRRDALTGFVVGVYRVKNVLAQALRNTPEIVESLRFHDIGSTDDRPLAVYTAATRSLTVGPEPHMPATRAIEIVRTFDLAGREWRISFDFGPDIVNGLRSFGPWAWLIAGLTLTFLTATSLARQQQRTRAVETLVAERTASLNDSNRQLTVEAEQRRKDQATIRDTTEILQAIIDESPSAIIGLDPQCSVIIWNRAAVRIFGYPAEEVLGNPYPLVPEGGEAEFREIVARTSAGERLHGMSVQRRHRNGKLLDIVFSGAPLYASDGRLRAMLFMLEDVTEQRAIERQFRQAQRMEAVGQLTGGIAHDFNNLLGVIIGNLDLVNERLADDAKTRALGESALRAALRGADLVKRLLAFSRKQPLAPTQISLNERLPELAALLYRALGEHISIAMVPGADLWPAVADASRIDDAILNLAINARDAMPGGGKLTIETANAHLDELYAAHNAEVVPGDYVMVAVTDTGTGMTPEIVERAFEPFFTTKEAGKGSGLGLSMVYGFAKQSGGHLKIYSELGVGTTVKLYLPRATVRGGDQADAAHDGVRSAAATLPMGSESILAVEDNADMRAVSERLLTELGYRVSSAESGPAALRLLDGNGTFDVLFTDLVMPGGMSGYDLAAEALKRRPGIKIVYTSGYADASLKNNGKSGDDPVVLGKPYRKIDLARAIRRAIDGKP
ncbi:MAG: CHASE domain-containing protein [Alphaproteobacteria bacterium]